MRKCNPQDIIREIPNVQSVVLPADWFKDLPTERSVFESLYSWMLSDGGVTAVDNNTIHSKTFVGQKLFKKLIAAEKKRIKKVHGLKDDELERAVSWSDSGSGPLTEIGDCTITGDVLLVIPDTSTEEYNEFLSKICRQEYEKDIERAKKYAAGGSFYEWLISQKERPDPVGHLAQDVYDDENFPKENKLFEEIHFYLENEGTFDDVIDCLKKAWFEYIKQYPERIEPSVWCCECKQKVELSEAVLAYEGKSIELFILDKQCFDQYRSYSDYHCIQLQNVSSSLLEELVENGTFWSHEAERIEELLKLWGIFPVVDTGDIGDVVNLVNLIQAFGVRP